MVPPHGEGITANVMPETMGVRGTDHGHFMFDRAPVPVANRLGEEGDGLGVALSGFLAPSRIAVAMTCVGLAQRALDLAVAYAKQRETFGKKIAQRQAIAFKLAEMADRHRRPRGRWCCSRRTPGRRAATPTPPRRWPSCSRSTCCSASPTRALQVHGGIGYWSSSPIERVYRDARAQRFEEGTNEIQKTVIARDLLSLNARPAAKCRPRCLRVDGARSARLLGRRDRAAEAPAPGRDGVDARRPRRPIEDDGRALAAFYAERAAAGAALIVTGGCAVSRVGAGGRSYAFVNEDASASALARVADAVHEAGGRILLQLFHAGRYAFERSFGLQPVAPSAVYSSFSRAEPRALSDAEVRRSSIDRVRRRARAGRRSSATTGSS